MATSRRDFNLIADAMLDSMPPLSAVPHRAQWTWDCKQVATALAHSNTRFVRVRFLDACGLTEKERES